jgi:cysteine desulfurase
MGRDAREALEEAREKVANLINAQPKEIIFTAGGTESDNMAVKGVAYWHQNHKPLPEHNRYHIITSPIEHPAIKNSCEYLEKNGFDVTYLSVNREGLIDLEELECAIREETILISIIFANNEIGTIQDIAAIGKLAKEHGITFHTDAVQALGKVRIDVNELNIDLLSMASHKIHGPKGVGAIYIRKGTRIEPLIHGGGHEFGFRSSTENVPGIVGFAKACEICSEEFDQAVPKMIERRDRLIAGIMEAIPDVYLNGHKTQRLPNNVNVGIRYIEGESILLNLDMLGVSVSTGSACSSKSLEPSHVLIACGDSHEDAHGSLRITLSRFTTDEEVDLLLEQLPQIVDKLRKMSPLYPEGGSE